MCSTHFRTFSIEIGMTQYGCDFSIIIYEWTASFISFCLETLKTISISLFQIKSIADKYTHVL